MADKINILWLSDSPTLPTGFSGQSRDLMLGLHKTGNYDITFLGHNYAGAPIRNFEFDDGLKIPFRLVGNHNAPYAHNLWMHYIRKYKADIFGTLLDTFMLKWAGPGMPMYEATPFPCRTTFWFPSDGGAYVDSDDAQGDPRLSILPMGCENVLRKTTLPVSMSEFGQKQAMKQYGIRTEFVPHGVNASMFRAGDKEAAKKKYGLQGRFVVGCVARNQPRKYLEATIRAFERFCRDKPDAVLFMHSVSGDSPITIKRNGIIEVMPIEDLEDLNDAMQYESKPLEGIEIWADNKFTKAKAISRHIYEGNLIRTCTKEGIIDTTPNHSLLDKDRKEIDAEKVKVGDSLATIGYPQLKESVIIDEELAWALGLFAAEGTANKYKEKNGTYSWQWKIVMMDKETILRAKTAFENSYSITFRLTQDNDKDKKYSGPMWRLVPCQERALAPLFTEWFYTRSRYKKIPPFMFAADNEAKRAFFEGFYAGDGSRNKYRQFTSKSKTLMHGLMLLHAIVYKRQQRTAYSEERSKFSKQDVDEASYFKCALTSSALLDNATIKKKVSLKSNHQFVYDIHTEDHTFAAGIGNLLVHNSDPNDVASASNSQDLIMRLRLQHRIRYSGMQWWDGFPVSDMPGIYNAMDVYLSTTTGEGFGVCTIEAMACQVPVVITDYTTGRELVKEKGEAGILVDVGTEIIGSWNVPRAFIDEDKTVEALNTLYHDAAMRDRMGGTGRKVVEQHYQWSRVIGDWDKLLQRLANG